MTRLAALLVIAASCTRSAPEPSPTHTASQHRSLDTLDGHALTGLSAPAPVDADPFESLTLAIDAKPLGIPPVRDARFATRPDALVLVAADGTLVHHDLATHAERVLDHDVETGFDVSASCRCVVYVQGEIGSASLRRISLDGGEAVTLAGDVGPAWLPVISPDGRTIAFASGRSGFAALWTVSLDGTDLRQRTNVGARSVDDLTPVPEGPERPRWDGTRLVFGPHAVDLAIALPTAPRAAPPRLP